MRNFTAALIAALSLAASSALAGDGNEAYLLQLSPDGSIHGNTLTILQDQADHSLVRGIGSNLTGGLPSFVLNKVTGANPLYATQRGEGNSAVVEMTGSGGEVQLLQASAPWAPWVPGGASANNVATIVASGNSLGGIIQIGELNTADLSLGSEGPLGSRGLITQLGNSLSADLNVGAGASGTVVQIGSNSTTGTVDVAPYTSLTYTQIGNNLVQSSAIQVYSTNPGNIVITQTAW